MINHASTGEHKTKSYNGDYMEIGKLGEEIVIEFLKKRPNVLGIIDLRDIRVVHEIDVDIAIRLYQGQICLAEIKTDTYLGQIGYKRRKNVINEVWRINHNSLPKYAGYLGWIFRSPAEFLIYYAPNCIIRNHLKPAIYIATFDNMRKILQNYTKGKHEITVVQTDEGKTTYNILIPEQEYLDQNIFKIYDLETNEELYTPKSQKYATSKQGALFT